MKLRLVMGRDIAAVFCGILLLLAVFAVLFHFPAGIFGKKTDERKDSPQTTQERKAGSDEKKTDERNDSPQTTQERKARSDDQSKKDIFAGVPLWNTEQDGQPEVRLRELVIDAAKRAKAELRSLGSVRTISIDAEHSSVEIDFTVVDEYDKIVHFIAEAEKQTPQLFWRRLEICVEPAARTADGIKVDPASTDDAGKVRLVGQFRVIKYTPADNETVSAADDSALAKEQTEKELLFPGDRDFLVKLYDLSLALPEDALVTDFRFNDGNCDLQIQTRDGHVDLARFTSFPYWQIGNLQKRVIADDFYTFTISLVGKDDPSQPQKDSVTPENKIATIVALNIFDQERCPNWTVNSGRGAVLSGFNDTSSAEASASDPKLLLQQALETRSELESMLQTLEQTPGATKEQTELLRQRIQLYDQQIEQLQEKQK